jgi:hypothetical protein
MGPDLLIEFGTFTHGIFCQSDKSEKSDPSDQPQGKYYKTFALEEETMRHTLMVANDTTIDYGRAASDDAYYHACLLAARLKVEGVEKVTGEMVEALSRVDGRQLIQLSNKLEERRELFRKETEAPPQGRAGAVEAGLPGGGSPGDEPGQG